MAPAAAVRSLVTTCPGQECEAFGFPAVVATPQLRDSHHAHGVLNPGSLVKSRLIIGSAVTPGRYQADVARLLKAAPGAHYLLTAHSLRLVGGPHLVRRPNLCGVPGPVSQPP
jgi:hypothetical protein